MKAEQRDCKNCKHHKEVCRGGIFYHSCESWDCNFELDIKKSGAEYLEEVGQEIGASSHDFIARMTGNGGKE